MSGDRGRGGPRLARWLLARATHPADRRFVVGDLDLEYADRRQRDGAASARRWYRQQAIRSLPASVRSRLSRATRGLSADCAANLRQAFRSFADSPLTVFVTVLSLSVGVAVLTTIFAFGQALMLTPVSMEVREPEQLAAIYTRNPDDPFGNSSYPDFLDIRTQAEVLVDVAAHRVAAVRLGDEASRRDIIEQVSVNYFELLGVRPSLGPGFSRSELRPAAVGPEVVLSHSYWRENLDAEAGILGQVLNIDGSPFTIVGVAPPDMRGQLLGVAVQAWVPLEAAGGLLGTDARSLEDRADRQYGLIARLRAGIAIEAASAEVAAVARRLADEYPKAWRGDHDQAYELTLLPESDARVPPNLRMALRGAIGMLMFAAALVLGLACANVALLLVARGDRRMVEIAIRRALGAERRQLVLMLLTHAALLRLASGLLGLVGAARAVGWLDTISLPIGDLSLDLAVRIDMSVATFALLLAVATGVVFGILPAVAATRAPAVWSLGGRGFLARGRGSRRPLRRLLIVFEVTLAVIFLIGCTVAYRSFGDVAALDWGVHPDGLAVVSLQPPEGLDDEARASWIRELRGRLASEPGIAATGVATAAEGSFYAAFATAVMRLDGFEPEDRVVTAVNAVTPGYFDLTGIRLLRGRGFRDSDDTGAPRVAVVNESVGRLLWGDENPIGRRFEMVALRLLGRQESVSAEYEVVGLAADARYQGFDKPDTGYVWTSVYQVPPEMLVLTVRGRPDASAAIPTIRNLARETERNLPLVTARPYSELLLGQFEFLRFAGRLLAWAAGFGILLATMGVYGVVAQSVVQRRREMAVRQAVGARPGEVVRTLLGDGLRLGLWGLALGLAVVVPVTSALRAKLGGVAPLDVPAALIGALVLLLAAVLASLVPALRITRVDLTAALRRE